MDSNDPSNPNSNIPGAQPTSIPLDSNQASGISQPNAVPSDQVISDIPQLPSNFSQTPTPTQPSPSFTTSAPEPPEASPAAATPANSWDQSPSQPAASPWSTPAPTTPSALPNDPLAPTAPPAAAWPSSTTAMTASDVPTAPAAPVEQANPFLQPQSGANFEIPQTPVSQPAPVDAATPAIPQAPQTPNPMATSAPDPLNTAFNPAGTTTLNPFAPTQAPTDPQHLGAPGEALPAATDPWGQPTQQPPAESPVALPAEPGSTGFIPTTPDSSASPPTPDNGVIQDQPISSNPQSTTLDLSSLQNGPAPEPASETPAPIVPPPQEGTSAPANPQATPPATQPMMPAENAPTDLSHLIAGEEQQPNQPMGNVYAPPVASDQPPGAPPQTPAAGGGATPPPEKHLNLTKVLLVAGIPIILIVAALSAYLILGVGQAAPEPDTSLPVEQTEQTQAPLTNPPPQIVAPSPQALQPAPTLPEPALPDSTLPTSSPIASPPLSTPTSAMDRLRAQQSPSPAASSTPAASTSPNSLSLPN